MDTLFDSNVWLALTFSAHPHHSLAKKFFATTTRESPACFCRATQQSFLRLATTPTLLHAYGAEGFTNLDAVGLIAALTKLPNIRMLPEPLELEPLWHRLAGLQTASPKVWMDAYKVFTAEELIAKGYPGPGGDVYAVFEVEEDPAYNGQEWDGAKLQEVLKAFESRRTYRKVASLGHNSAVPRVLSLRELLKALTD